MGAWILRRLLRLDEWANRNLLNGWRRETISSRCGKAILRTRAGIPDKGDWKWVALGAVIDAMPWFGTEHCVRAVQPHRGRPI